MGVLVSSGNDVPKHTNRVVTLMEKGLMSLLTRRLMLVVGFAGPGVLGAQSTAVSPADIRDMMELAVDQLMPDTASPSRVQVAKRGVFWDVPRTLRTFGVADNAVPSFAQLKLKNPRIREGAIWMLGSCPTTGSDRCKNLGWRVYTYAEPILVTESQVVIRTWFLWADRGTETFQNGAAPGGGATLTGYFTEMEFARVNGALKFVKKGRTFML